MSVSISVVVIVFPLFLGRAKSSNVVGSPQHLSSTLANDHTGSHCVAGCHARHDRAVSNTKVVDSIDFEMTIYDRHGVSAHLGGTGLMPIGHGGIPDEVVEVGALQITRHDFAFGEWLECHRVADL